MKITTLNYTQGLAIIITTTIQMSTIQVVNKPQVYCAHAFPVMYEYRNVNYFSSKCLLVHISMQYAEMASIYLAMTF